MKIINLASLALAVVAVFPAHADLITFIGPAPVTKAAFLTATAATSATTFPSDPVTGNDYPEFTDFTSGLLTFSPVTGGSTRFFTLNASTRLPGNELLMSGTESFNVAIANGPVFSFGWDFVEPEFDPQISTEPFFDSTFTVTLLDGVTPVGSFPFNAPNDTAAFVGVCTDVAFDHVEIRETVGGVEDEFFGQFYSGNTLHVVPEPSSAALLLCGAALLLRRRRFDPNERNG